MAGLGSPAAPLERANNPPTREHATLAAGPKFGTQ